MKRLLAPIVLAFAIAGIVLWLRAMNPPAAVHRPPAPVASVPLSDAKRLEIERWFQAQPRYNVPVSPEGAAVLIVKFTDYQCPGCAATHYALAPVLAKYETEFPGAVRLVSKQFPWNTDCNPNAVRTLHAAACDAAVAAVLTGQQQRADLENWLYSNGPDLTAAGVREAAARIGHITDLAGSYSRAVDTIKADAEVARLLGVTQTPTFFVNGVKVTDMSTMPPEAFDAAIRYELRRIGR